MHIKRLAISALVLAAPIFAGMAAASPRFSVSFPKEQSAAPLDGRLLLLVSTDPSAEPRMQINDTPAHPDDIRRRRRWFAAGASAAVVDERAFGYPVHSLADLKPGEYYVQAVLHVYETFHRSDGHTVKLPMDRGEGQHWNLAPGNLIQQTAESSPLASGGANRDRSRPGNSADSRAERHQVRPPRQNPERSC